MIEKQILEFRALDTNDETLKIRAKVNDYNKSKILKDRKGKPFVEIAPKEMWEKCLNDEVRVFINHKDYYNVGKNHKFDIQEDGVYLEIELDPIKEKGIYDNVKKGILNQVSFGFSVVKDTFKKVGNYFERTLHDIKISEISLLDKMAAYNGTAIECRNLEVPNQFNQLKLIKMKLELEKLKFI